MIRVDQLVHGSLEIPGQGTADTAGIQFGYGDAGIFHEAAVNADFAVFVLQQYDFLVPEASGEQFFDECGLSGSEESGDHVDLYHNIPLLSFREISRRSCI